LGAHRIPGDAERSSFLTALASFRVLALERCPATPSSSGRPTSGSFIMKFDDRLQVAAALDPAEERERPQHEQRPPRM